MTTTQSGDGRTTKTTPGRRAIAAHLRQRPLLVGLIALGIVVLMLSSYLDFGKMYTLNAFLLACMGAIALNLLMGTAGQVSVGNAAFLGVGGFSAAYFVSHNLMFPLDVILAALVSAVVGILIGLPALRLSGLYLALATLAGHFLVVFVGTEYQSHEEKVGGFPMEGLFTDSDPLAALQYWSFMLFGIVALVILGAAMLMRSKTGRALRIIRDHPAVAPMLGIAVARYKLTVFAIASAIIGLQGALAAHLNGFVVVENFTLVVAFSYLAMIIVGGMDSIAGAVIGAAVVIGLPVFVPDLLDVVFGSTAEAYAPQVSQMMYGALVVLFIVASPNGIIGWIRARGRRSSASAGVEADSAVEPR
ncbi:branched-chain amino acid ABC transporter permease [Nocardia rhamnosiphila]|uniref:Branched-chain amino acid ABC transporter permease n=1 Tax=Nocardia rhamnosiphila TaxID=426716 RepID=A0ABV2WYR2_9NOCA